MQQNDLWVWIRVPLSALERAMDALKERVATRHWWKQRDEANSDSEAAKAIKEALRTTHEDNEDGNSN
jgi:hypothetical protein